MKIADKIARVAEALRDISETIAKPGLTANSMIRLHAAKARFASEMRFSLADVMTLPLHELAEIIRWRMSGLLAQELAQKLSAYPVAPAVDPTMHGLRYRTTIYAFTEDELRAFVEKVMEEAPGCGRDL